MGLACCRLRLGSTWRLEDGLRGVADCFTESTRSRFFDAAARGISEGQGKRTMRMQNRRWLTFVNIDIAVTTIFEVVTSLGMAMTITNLDWLHCDIEVIQVAGCS